MEASGSAPDIDAIIADSQNLLATGATTPAAAIAGLNKIIAALRESLMASEEKLRQLRDFVEKIERDHPGSAS
jgi:hypothetical protein